MKWKPTTGTIGLIAACVLAVGLSLQHAQSTPRLAAALGQDTPTSTPVPTPNNVPPTPLPLGSATPAPTATTEAEFTSPLTQSLATTYQTATTSGGISGGCAPAAQLTACVPTISVDGHTLPNMATYQNTLGVASMSIGQHNPGGTAEQESALAASPLRPDTTAGVQGGAAWTILNYLLYVHGVQAGITVSTSEATSDAQQALDAYKSDPANAQYYPFIPSGMTPDAYFLSSQMIAAYQHFEIEQLEANNIIGAAPSTQSRSGALASWMNGVLSQHTVLINGQPPTFSLPNAITGTGWTCETPGC